MQTAIERRQFILEAISARRMETCRNLAEEFGVSEKTIRNDIVCLSCSYPIYTVQGNGGGIRAADGWYLNRTYLTPEQEALLESLKVGLQADQMAIMDSIFASFAKPKVKA